MYILFQHIILTLIIKWYFATGEPKASILLLIDSFQDRGHEHRKIGKIPILFLLNLLTLVFFHLNPQILGHLNFLLQMLWKFNSIITCFANFLTLVAMVKFIHLFYQKFLLCHLFNLLLIYAWDLGDHSKIKSKIMCTGTNYTSHIEELSLYK